MAASLPVQHIVTRLRRLGIPAFVSRDAGGYLCNATLYHSLGCAGTRPAAASASSIFRRRSAGPVAQTAGASAVAALTWEQAHAGGLEILAACLHLPAAPARTSAP